MKTKYFILFCIAGSLAFSCRKNKPEPETPQNFSKRDLLTQTVDALILPKISEYSSSVSLFAASVDSFTQQPDVQHFDRLKMALESAYLNWQSIAPFDLGPMRDNGLKSATNTYPADTTQIEQNIQNGSANLNSAANIDAVGLPAIEYLLYRSNAFAQLNQSNTLAYLRKLRDKLVSDAQLLQNGWTQYRSTYIASDGTESTSAFSQLVNEFNRDFELVKNAKVGIPIGRQSLGIPLPEYLEARYSGRSKELMIANLRSLKQLFNGGNGIGFDDYLIALEKADLAERINLKFDEMIQIANSINGTLEQATQSESGKLDALYLSLSEQVVNIKTDMTSAFGVLITYQDNDGD